MQESAQQHIDFSQEQRQSVSGVWIEFGSMLKKYIRAFFVLIIYLFLKLEWIYYIYILGGVFLALILLAAVAYLQYQYTVFYIDQSKREFILKKGIFNREKFVLSIDKILQVNLNQSFWQQVFKVYAVEIETAGTSDQELKIPALDLKIAQALKSELIGINPQERLDTEPKVDLRAPIRIAYTKLVLHAFTADYLRSFLLMLGLIISVYSRIHEYAETFLQPVEDWESEAYHFFKTQSIALALLGIFLFSIFVNAVRNIIRYFDLKIRPEATTTWISYGLFSKKNILIQNDRIQTFSIETQLIQKKLGLFLLRISQSSADITADKKAKVKIIGLSENQAEQMFEQTYHEKIPTFSTHLKANFRIAILPFVLFFLLPTIAAAITIFITKSPLVLLIFPSLYLAASFYFIPKFKKSYQLSISNKFLKLRSEMWTSKALYVRVQDIQAVSIQQESWLKRAQLAHINLQTAGGNLRFSYGDERTLRNLADWILYQIESKTNHRK